MNKEQFLIELQKGLIGLPQDDINERLAFYSEIIDDRIEEGVLEEDAISALGTVSEIVSQVISEIPLAKIAKERIKPKRKLKALEIVLLAVGSPIWLSLGIAAFAVIFSLYISLWSVIISLWAVFVALAVCTLCAIVSGIVMSVSGNGINGVAVIGTGTFCAGLCILMFYACTALSKGIFILTKRFMVSVKNCFIKKEKS